VLQERQGLTYITDFNCVFETSPMSTNTTTIRENVDIGEVSNIQYDTAKICYVW